MAYGRLIAVWRWLCGLEPQVKLLPARKLIFVRRMEFAALLVVVLGNR